MSKRDIEVQRLCDQARRAPQSAADFEVLWAEAQQAAIAAAEEEIAKLGDQEDSAEPGSAWLSMPRTLPFARWAQQADITNDEGEGDAPVEIWDAWIAGYPMDALCVHEAGAQAARKVLVRGLQTPDIHVVTMLDLGFRRAVRSRLIG
jgi:hypothetical protein